MAGYVVIVRGGFNRSMIFAETAAENPLGSSAGRKPPVMVLSKNRIGVRGIPGLPGTTIVSVGEKEYSEERRPSQSLLRIEAYNSSLHCHHQIAPRTSWPVFPPPTLCLHGTDGRFDRHWLTKRRNFCGTCVSYGLELAKSR